MSQAADLSCENPFSQLCRKNHTAPSRLQSTGKSELPQNHKIHGHSQRNAAGQIGRSSRCLRLEIGSPILRTTARKGEILSIGAPADALFGKAQGEHFARPSRFAALEESQAHAGREPLCARPWDAAGKGRMGRSCSMGSSETGCLLSGSGSRISRIAVSQDNFRCFVSNCKY
jgi:hypothetical protein